MMIGNKQECLDKIEQYARCGVSHFIFISVLPFTTEEICSYAEDVIAAVRAS